MDFIWLAMSVANALIVTLAFYLLITYLDSAVVLELKKKKKIVSDKVVIIDAIVTFLLTGVITYLRYPAMMLEMKILTSVFLVVMATLTVCDIKKKIVPNRIILIALGIWMLLISIGILLHTEQGVALLGRSLIGGVIAGVIFLLVYLLTKKKLGAGDVKFAFILGLYMTSSRMFGGIFYGSILCCIFSLVMIALKKLTFKSGVPMIPFLYLGCLITYIIL
ncbi:MAG: prepilin peptidase [Lachnospiraceae bacterium]|nr:prepilin peptidase [Lachnospiraceae bacterium]